MLILILQQMLLWVVFIWFAYVILFFLCMVLLEITQTNKHFFFFLKETVFNDRGLGGSITILRIHLQTNNETIICVAMYS